MICKCKDIRSAKSKDRQYNGQKEKWQRDTMGYKTLYRKLKILSWNNNYVMKGGNTYLYI